MKSSKALQGNANRQARYRERQADAGKRRLVVWLEFDTMNNLWALAARRRMTIEQALAVAIDAEWQAAGEP